MLLGPCPTPAPLTTSNDVMVIAFVCSRGSRTGSAASESSMARCWALVPSACLCWCALGWEFGGCWCAAAEPCSGWPESRLGAPSPALPWGPRDRSKELHHDPEHQHKGRRRKKGAPTRWIYFVDRHAQQCASNGMPPWDQRDYYHFALHGITWHYTTSSTCAYIRLLPRA